MGLARLTTLSRLMNWRNCRRPVSITGLALVCQGNNGWEEGRKEAFTAIKAIFLQVTRLPVFWQSSRDDS